MAANPSTGETRVVVEERQDTWQRNRPEMRFLEDGNRFIWETEKSGWKQWELRDLDGTLVNPLTGTTDAEHMKTDLDVFDFQLQPDEITKIEQIACS